MRDAGQASQRIMDMGLCLGTPVKVVKSAPFHGPVEVSVRDTTLALGRGLAEKIYVEVEEGESEPSAPTEAKRGDREVAGGDP